MLQGSYEFLPQDSIVYGRPAAEVVREEAKRLGIERILIVSSRSAAATAYCTGLTKALGPLVAGSYAGVTAHSPRNSVIAGAAAAREARADLLLAVGGGSVIDAAKLMLLCLWQDITEAAALDPYHKVASIDLGPRPTRSGKPPVRLVAVPTTLSGAEFTAQAGVTDESIKTKQSYVCPLFAPRVVVLDPAATVETPEWLMLSTGIRAVDHCVETYCSTGAMPLSDALSAEGLRMLTRDLPRLKSEPADLDNRLACQMAVWLSITGFMNGVPLGASHGIGRVLGGSFGVPHGRTSCIMLPATLRWNASVDGARQQAVNALMGNPRPTAAESVEALVRSLGEPTRLSELGLTRAIFPELAEKSVEKLKHRSVSGNPRPVRGTADVLEILELAF
jgi:maleylacetate reductase